MTLNQLNYFVSVCENDNSMTQSAKALFVAQSSISVAIKDLEKELGVLLFLRDKKSLALTEDGRNLYRMAKRIVTDVNRLTDYFQEIREAMPATKIGFSAICRAMFTQSVEDFCAEESGAHIKAYTVETKDLCDFLQDGSIDLAIIGTSRLDDYDGYERRLLGTRQICLHTYPGNPLAARAVIAVDNLVYEPMTFFSEDAREIRAMSKTKRLITNLVLNNIVHYTTQIEMLKDDIHDKRSSVILSEGILRSDDYIVAVPIEGMPCFEIVALWRKDVSLSSHAVRFLQHLKAEME